jgi:hypothetical protein
MKNIETFSFVYNEEYLLPFYFKHYDFCDRLNIIYDVDSTDKTIELLKSNPKVRIIPYHFKNMMNDQEKVDFINSCYGNFKEDTRILNIDADEFVFTDRNELENFNVNALSVSLYNVYRHVTEQSLNIDLSVKEQRRHGILQNIYIKPIIVKANLNISWGVGNHTLTGTNVIDAGIIGAHWANADTCFCVDRRVKNRMLRQSRYNLEHGLTIQHHNITEQDVINECELHKNDPEVF